MLTAISNRNFMLPDGAEADVPASWRKCGCRPASLNTSPRKRFSPRSAACKPPRCVGARSSPAEPVRSSHVYQRADGRYVYTEALKLPSTASPRPATWPRCRWSARRQSAGPDRDRFGGGRHHSVDHDQLPDEPGQQHLDKQASYTAITANGSQTKTFSPLERYTRLSWTVTGTTPTSRSSLLARPGLTLTTVTDYLTVAQLKSALQITNDDERRSAATGRHFSVAADRHALP